MTKMTRLMSAVVMLPFLAAGCGPSPSSEMASTAKSGAAGLNMVTLYIPEMSDRLKLL